MFWNKKKEKVTLLIDCWGDLIFVDKNGEYKELATKKIVRKDFAVLSSKLNLILDHLNLQYIPETEKKEPAKLVEKIDLSELVVGCVGNSYLIRTSTQQEKPKKKAGRPKKK